MEELKIKVIGAEKINFFLNFPILKLCISLSPSLKE